jgi:ribulose-5-phosphate 4-epimerase/fuculose-1-phosphate aldolase
VHTSFDPSPDLLVPPLSPRQELAILARALHREGYEEHIAGHLSYKQPDGTLLVNPYHLRWDELQAKHICRIDLDGNKLEGDWFVSLAIQLHLVLHRHRDVGVAVHNHPTWGSIWASMQRIPPVYDQTSAITHGDIALYDDYGTPVADQDEAEGAVEALGDKDIALLAHHGVLVLGADPGQAYARAMSLEWRCRTAWHVEAAGGATPMPVAPAEKLARGIDRRGYPGLWEAMARQEIQLDPRVLEEQ